MRRSEMVTWLSARYDEQALNYPTMREIPKRVYVNVNLAYMLKSDYWRKRRVANE